MTLGPQSIPPNKETPTTTWNPEDVKAVQEAVSSMGLRPTLSTASDVQKSKTPDAGAGLNPPGISPPQFAVTDIEALLSEAIKVLEGAMTKAEEGAIQGNRDELKQQQEERLKKIEEAISKAKKAAKAGKWSKVLKHVNTAVTVAVAAFAIAAVTAATAGVGTVAMSTAVVALASAGMSGGMIALDETGTTEKFIKKMSEAFDSPIAGAIFVSLLYMAAMIGTAAGAGMVAQRSATTAAQVGAQGAQTGASAGGSGTAAGSSSAAAGSASGGAAAGGSGAGSAASAAGQGAGSGTTATQQNMLQRLKDSLQGLMDQAKQGTLNIDLAVARTEQVGAVTEAVNMAAMGALTMVQSVYQSQGMKSSAQATRAEAKIQFIDSQRDIIQENMKHIMQAVQKMYEEASEVMKQENETMSVISNLTSKNA